MDMFSALAEPTRRSILEMLAESGQLSASDIYAKFRVSPPAISQHLKALREANLVQVEKRAQQRLYQINPDSLIELSVWIQHLTKQWEKRFNRLDKLLEVEKRKVRERG
ncbi:MAG: metalloregulator ArsR/SmtB family transcription factor [Patescibacteria group bacterium]